MVMALETVFSMERLQGQGKDSSPSSGPRMLTGLFSCTSRAGDFGTLITVSDHCPSFFRDDKMEMHVFLAVFGTVKMDKKNISGHIKRTEKWPSWGQAEVVSNASS